MTELRDYLIRMRDRRLREGNDAEARAYEDALEELNAQSEQHAARVVVVMEGGLIQDVLAEEPAHVVVIDYDADEADPDSPGLVMVPQDGYEDGSPAWIAHWTDLPRINPATENGAFLLSLVNAAEDGDA